MGLNGPSTLESPPSNGFNWTKLMNEGARAIGVGQTQHESRLCSVDTKHVLSSHLEMHSMQWAM